MRPGAWPTADGLEMNSVTAMVQTRDGYLWLGTYNGLMRFDGVRFTVFTSGGERELKNSRITALFEDGVSDALVDYGWLNDPSSGG